MHSPTMYQSRPRLSSGISDALNGRHVNRYHAYLTVRILMRNTTAFRVSPDSWLLEIFWKSNEKQGSNSDSESLRDLTSLHSPNSHNR